MPAPDVPVFGPQGMQINTGPHGCPQPTWGAPHGPVSPNGALGVYHDDDLDVDVTVPLSFPPQP